MKQHDKAMRVLAMSGGYVGTVAAVCCLRSYNWTVEEIAAQMENIQRACGLETIRACGLNGERKVESLFEHMQRFGETVGERLRELRAVDISTN